MITLTKVQVSELAVTTVLEFAARLRPVRLSQRHRIHHRPAAARCAVGADHDQQRPHPDQSRHDVADDAAADLDQRLSAPVSPDGALAHIRSRIWPIELFRPMGVDGVYARTALYVDLVERLEAIHHAAARPASGNHALPAGDEPHPAGEVRLPEELPQSAGLRVRPARLGGLDPLGRRTLRQRRRLDHVADLVGPGAVARRPAIPCIRSSRRAASCRAAACSSTSRRTCSDMSLRSSLDRLQSFRMREFVRIGSPDEIVDFREKWMAKAPLLAAELGLPHYHRRRERSVFRPRRPGHGGEPAAAGAEIRTVDPLLSRRIAHRLHELQLSPRTFRPGVGHPRRRRANWRTPAASPSASTGWRWRLFANHGLDLRKWPASTRQALAL